MDERAKFTKALSGLVWDIIADMKRGRTTKTSAASEEREVKTLYRLAGFGDPTPAEVENILEA